MPPPESNALFPTPLAPASLSDAQSQINRLQEMVQHLEGQVKVLSDENASLLQKLGSVGMKSQTPPSLPNPTPGDSADDNDYVGLSTALLKLRQLEMLPVPVVTQSEEAVRAVVLAWLKSIHAPDHGLRYGRALYALGLVPEVIDTLPATANLLARQLSGWWDEKSQSLLVIPPHKEPGGTLIATDPTLAIAYGQLLRFFSTSVFGPDFGKLSTDERLARLAVLGGDASLTRLLYSIANPSAQDNAFSLPPDDPDHPLNQLPTPDFIRQTSVFPLIEGFEFAQTLHSISGWPQLTAAYQRLPESSAEVLDTERYLNETRVPPDPVSLNQKTLDGAGPAWDDRLGQQVLVIYLKRYMDPELAHAAALGWRGDRFVVFADAAGGRGHSFWRVKTPSSEMAKDLRQAFTRAVLQHYGLPEDNPLPTTTPAEERTINVIQDGAGVTLIDTGTQPAAHALQNLK